MVSSQLVEELQMIIKQDYGVELLPQEVSEIANTLVGFFDLLAKIEFENNEEDLTNEQP